MEHESRDDGAPMLGPNGGMLFETSVVDSLNRDLRWGGPEIEAQSWEKAEERASQWSHDRIAGYVLGYAACGKPLEPAAALVRGVEESGRGLKLRVDGILYGVIPA